MADKLLIPERHPSLPKNFNDRELEVWLRSNALETFIDEKKTYFTDEELKELAVESSKNGREINRLNDMLNEIKMFIAKGNDTARTFVIPETIGTKILDKHRRENDDFAERGYTTEETELFGIPNPDTHMLEYFDLQGNIYDDRTRALSAREKHKIGGIFKDLKQDSDGQAFDSGTGEVVNL